MPHIRKKGTWRNPVARGAAPPGKISPDVRPPAELAADLLMDLRWPRVAFRLDPAC